MHIPVDKMKILEQLLAHMDDSQGKDLHELVKSKQKPEVAVELDMEKKMSPMDLAKHESMESPEHEKMEKLMGDKDKAKLPEGSYGEKKDDEEEVSDEEIEEMLKGLA